MFVINIDNKLSFGDAALEVRKGKQTYVIVWKNAACHKGRSSSRIPIEEFESDWLILEGDTFDAASEEFKAKHEDAENQHARYILDFIDGYIKGNREPEDRSDVETVAGNPEDLNSKTLIAIYRNCKNRLWMTFSDGTTVSLCVDRKYRYTSYYKYMSPTLTNSLIEKIISGAMSRFNLPIRVGMPGERYNGCLSLDRFKLDTVETAQAIGFVCLETGFKITLNIEFHDYFDVPFSGIALGRYPIKYTEFKKAGINYKDIVDGYLRSKETFDINNGMIVYDIYSFKNNNEFEYAYKDEKEGFYKAEELHYGNEYFDAFREFKENARIRLVIGPFMVYSNYDAFFEIFKIKDGKLKADPNVAKTLYDYYVCGGPISNLSSLLRHMDPTLMKETLSTLRRSLGSDTVSMMSLMGEVSE